MAPETFVTYQVEYWVDRYDYWAIVSEPAESTFALPVCEYNTEEEARARRDAVRANNPGGKYQLVKKTTTVEVIEEV